MPIRPYAISRTFTEVTRENPDFRGKNKALGDWISTDMDFQQVLNQLPSTVLQLYQAGRTADVQDQLVQLNLQRAQQGKAPITLDMVGGASLVQPGVNVSLSPETKQTLIYGGVALAALMLLNRGKSKQR